MSYCIPYKWVLTFVWLLWIYLSSEFHSNSVSLDGATDTNTPKHSLLHAYNYSEWFNPPWKYPYWRPASVYISLHPHLFAGCCGPYITRIDCGDFIFSSWSALWQHCCISYVYHNVNRCSTVVLSNQIYDTLAWI